MIIYENYQCMNGKNVIKNPNSNIVKNIKTKCEQNSGYCPCKTERTQDNICPCKELRELGNCDCSLYVQILNG